MTQAFTSSPVPVAATVSAVLSKCRCPLRCTRQPWFGQRYSPSTIDHVFVSPRFNSELSYVRSLHDWDLSDHLPVLARLVLPVGCHIAHHRPTAALKFHIGHLQRQTAKEASAPDSWDADYMDFVCSNFFDPLTAEFDELDDMDYSPPLSDDSSLLLSDASSHVLPLAGSSQSATDSDGDLVSLDSLGASTIPLVSPSDSFSLGRDEESAPPPSLESIHSNSDRSSSPTWSPELTNRLALHFETAVKRAAKAGNLYRVVRRRCSGPRLSQACRRMIKKRQKAYKKLRKLQRNGAQLAEEYRLWKEQVKGTSARVSAERQKEWDDLIAKVSGDLKDCPKQGWSIIRRFGGWSPRHDCGIQPMKDPSLPGSPLVVNSQEILKLWERYFDDLHRDHSGLSLDPLPWQGKHTPCSPQQCDAMQTLNDPFTMDELQTALRKTKPGKAPGMDEIPSDVYKLVMETAPVTPMGNLLLKLLNGVYSSGHIPTSWQEAVLVPVYKKGDETDPSNYRGISLINTTLKLLCLMFHDRLLNKVEALKILKPYQAGFRPGEEAVAQAACLVEILQRRHGKKLPSLANFIDVRKAYDTVPIQGLLSKLEHTIGLSGTSLQFLKSLYATSKVRVRIGKGSSAMLSAPITLERGLRQGCILSPLLFNIFVNDIFDEALEEGLGVTVPGCNDDLIVPGLLFADDLCLMAPDTESMGRLNALLSAWMQRHAMSVNVPKCGLLPIKGFHLGSEPCGRRRTAANCWRIQRQRIPIVRQYTYLGVLLDSELSVDTMMEGRLKKASKVLPMIAHWTHAHSVPTYLRVMVVRAVYTVSLLYGTEIHGGSQQRLASSQLRLNRLLRCCLGVSSASHGQSSSGIDSLCLYREFNAPPLLAQAVARRCRLYTKAHRLGFRTLLSLIVRNSAGIGSGSKWSSQSKSLMTRYGATPSVDCRKVYEMVLDQVWQSLEKKKLNLHTPCFQWYFRRKFWISPVLKRSTALCGNSWGLKYLMMMRLGSWWSASKLSKCGLIPDQWGSTCPFCLKPVPETIEHCLLACPAWDAQRVEGLNALLEEIADGFETHRPVSLEELTDPPVQNLGDDIDDDNTDDAEADDDDSTVESVSTVDDWDTFASKKVMLGYQLTVLLGGQPGREFFLPDLSDNDEWTVPKDTRPEFLTQEFGEKVLQTVLGFLNSVAKFRSPRLRELNSTESQSQSGRASTSNHRVRAHRFV